MNDRPILARALDAYFEQEVASFHMPGHKQRGGVHPVAIEILGAALLDADVSEMGGFDYLHAPEGAMQKAQEHAALVFGAAHTFFLVNGSTGGNLAAITAFAGDADNVVMMRGSHRSVYTACVLSGATPHYIPMAYDGREDGWFLPQFPRHEHTLPNRSAVVHVTRPNYYGMAVDLAEFRALADRLGAVLVVDEAHGSHFSFDTRLPQSALEQGADIVIQSTHKTLGALTQSSMLHVRDGVPLAPLRRALAMLQSSSPSALLTLSLDFAAHHLASTGQGRAELDAAIRNAQTIAREIDDIKGLRVLRQPNADPTKVVIDVRSLGITGFGASAWLRDERKVWIELADFHRIVCMISGADTTESCTILVDALRALAAAHPEDREHTGTTKREPIPASASTLPPIPPQRHTLRAAVQSPTRAVAINQSLGHVCAEYVIPYPPGIPLVVPGEELTAEVLQAIAAFRVAGSKIVGPDDPTGATLLVCDGSPNTSGNGS